MISAACGWDHTLLLTASGRVLTAGGDTFGQRGLGKARRRPAGASRRANADTVTDTAATGEATDSGTSTASVPPFAFCPLPLEDVLAASKMEDMMSKDKIAMSQNGVEKSQLDGAASCDRVPSHGEVVTSRSVCITSVSAGLRHSAAVTSQGQLLVWGDNSRGQLGESLSHQAVHC